MSNNKWIKTTAKALITLVITLFALYYGFLGFIILAFMAVKPVYFISIIIGAINILALIYLLIWNKHKIIKSKFYFIISTSVIIAVSLIFGTYDYIIASIPTLNEQGVDLTKYEPHKKGSLVAKLEKPSSLSLSDNLPKLDCATALYPVMSAFVEAVYPEREYDTEYKKEELTDAEPVRVTTTTGAYYGLINGEVDIIFVAGPSDEQMDIARDAGVNLKLTPIGKEAFVFFVNSKNPINDLTIEDIQGIYSGKITNWETLGWKNMSIRAFQRPKNSGSQTALESLMQNKELMTPPKDDVIDGMGGIIENVASYKNYKNAIGYSFKYFSTEMVKNNQIKLLKLNGVEPNKETIKSGEYPISSHFYAITTDKNTNPNVDILIDWILGDEGQYLIEKTGYVAIN